MAEVREHPFGKILKRFRESKGFKAKELADRLNVHRNTIGNWEKNASRPVNAQLDDIVRVLRLNKAEKNELEQAYLGNAVPFSVLAEEPATTSPIASPSPAQEPAYQNTPEIAPAIVQPQQNMLMASRRKRMLDDLNQRWITNILDHPLYGTKLIPLTLHKRFGLVVHPLNKRMQDIGFLHENVSENVDIVQMYDEACGKLLILVDPGSGKSFLLLTLLRELIQRAHTDQGQPIPVVFSLYSWAPEQESIEEWLLKQLCDVYHVPLWLAQLWTHDDQILPLLDGLDEVPEDQQPACVEAINLYNRQHGLLTPAVVCSCTEKYLALPLPLLMDSAVVIHPLSYQQIQDYLANADMHLTALSSVMENDDKLKELASTPFMLNVLARTYYDCTVESIVSSISAEGLQKRIIEQYVLQVLRRREIISPYKKEQISGWLTWLAQKMIQDNQLVFYIERMQLSMLSEKSRYWLHPGIIMGCVYGIIIGLIKGIDYGMIFNLWTGIANGLCLGIANALIYVLINGPFLSALVKRERQQSSAATYRPRGWNWQKIDAWFNYHVVYGCVLGILNAIIILVWVDLPAGLVNGIFIGLFYGFQGRLDTTILPAEDLKLSWKKVMSLLPKILGASVLIGLFYGIFTGLPYFHHLQALLPYILFGLSIGFVVGMLLEIATGVTYKQFTNTDIMLPNQGIRNSLKNSLRVALLGLLFGGIFVLVYAIVPQFVFGVGQKTLFPGNSSEAFGIQDGLTVTAFLWLSMGGTACIQHAHLRILLWRDKCIPWNYSHFLDHVSERLLLRKVGGGYEFIHSLLREHYATLSPGSIPEENE